MSTIKKLFTEANSRRRKIWLTLVVVSLLVAGVSLAVSLAKSTNKAERVDAGLSESQDRGVAIREILCEGLNRNATQVNRQMDFIIRIYLGNVEESRPFDKQYRELGFPPFAERLEEAHNVAASLESYKVEMIDCKSFVNDPEHFKLP